MVSSEESVRTSGKRLEIVDTSSPSSIENGNMKVRRGVILVPQPSDDPRDPLNWPQRRKFIVLAIVCMASFSGLASATAHLSSLVVQAEVYGKTPVQLSYSISAVIAGLIVGPMLFVPLAQVVGASSVILWSLVGAMVCGIWSAEMTGPHDYIPFVLSRLIGGLFCSVPQILGNGVIVNIFFLHERGKTFAVYSTVYILGSAVGPTFSGLIVSHTNWPVEYWWTIGLQALLIILAFFFLEESGFPRDGKPYPCAPESFLSNRIATYFPGSKVVPGVSRSTLAKFAIAPFLIGLSPAAICAGLIQLTGFGWLVTIQSQLAIFLQEPPQLGGYGFTPQQNAFFLFSIWIGIFVAQAWGQLFSDRIPMWLCKRRGGTWVPEFRLHTLWIPGLIVMPVGLGIFGAALQYHLHYMVLALGAFLITVAATVSVPVSVNYVVESFKRNPQEVGTIMNAYRLLLALVVQFFISPWAKQVGIGWVFGMMAFFSIFSFMLIVLLMFKGHQIRQWSFASVAAAEEGAKVTK